MIEEIKKYMESTDTVSVIELAQVLKSDAGLIQIALDLMVKKNIIEEIILSCEGCKTPCSEKGQCATWYRLK